jgi:pimeloyl-ACP methyl ester carboxylesterase
MSAAYKSKVYKSGNGERIVRERYLEILKRWPLPNRQLLLSTREGETFVIVGGEENAPPIVLLHGSAANSAVWTAAVTAWAPHFRIYAVDVIGEPGLSAGSRPPLNSHAHALWMDDVMQGLGLARASFVGGSLGGWLALDYAIRRPERVATLALLCPGGVGRQKIGFFFKTMPLLLFGDWGVRKVRGIILGRTSGDAPPAVRDFFDFLSLIGRHFRPRTAKLPVFGDDALRSLKMPLLAIVGGKDVLIDSSDTRRRLERLVSHAEVRYLPEAGHLIPGQWQPILEFLRRTVEENHV